MNFNTSPIAFYASKQAQSWRRWFAQRKIWVICGSELLPFYIVDNGEAPSAGELYEPNTDTKVADITLSPYLIDHTISVDGQSRHIWIFQGGVAGVFGYSTPGYYYLKVGSWYSDIFSIGYLPDNYVEVSWQFYDDVFCANGEPISKHIKYKQIFATNLWHPSYGIEEEGKTNNGIFYAMQQTTKKTSGFSAIVNEEQLDCLNLTRMADIITIKAVTDGVTKTMQTNQFEITSKWESDDVASINCEFDLFNIVRKYQQSNVEPEPLPIPVPPAPPSNYYIKGSVESGVSSITLEINGTSTNIQCINGAFEYGYDNALTSLSTVNVSWQALANVDKIKTLDLSATDGLNSATKVVLSNMTNCTSINFGNCTFAAVTTIEDFCYKDEKLTSVSIPEGTFASVVYGRHSFDGCKALTSVSMPKAALIHGCDNMFCGCTALKTIDMPLATFATSAHATSMFEGCTSLETVDMSAATFAACGTMDYMFRGAKGFDDGYYNWTLDFGVLFPSCSAQPTSATGMFENSKFVYVDLTGLDMSLCTDVSKLFKNANVYGANITTADMNGFENISEMFLGCQHLDNNTMTLLSSATFVGATNAASMFAGADSLSHSLTLTSATFANVTNAGFMFSASKFTTISVPAATFASVTNAQRMFYNCTSAETIDMTSATFGSVTDASSIFLNCNALVTLTVPSSATWTTSISFAQSENMGIATLTNLSRWCADMSGGSAKTLTLNPNAKSRFQLPATIAQYTLASSTLSAKNWSIQ